MKQILMISFTYGGLDWDTQYELPNFPLTRWEDNPELLETIVFGLLFASDWCPPISSYKNFKIEVVTLDADPNDVR